MEQLKFRSRFALLLAILIAPFAGVSAASLIDLNGSGSAAANASAAANPALNATVNTNTSASDATDLTNSRASSRANVNANVNAAGDVNTNRASDNASGSANANAQAEDMNANDMSVWNRDTVTAAGAANADMTAGSVQTDADLKSFAATSLKNDDNLNTIGFAQDRVEVAYRVPARFLGIFPSSVNMDVVARTDGTVVISYPWYGFLMVADRASLESSVKNEIGAYMSQHNASATALQNANSNSALHASTTATSTASSTAVVSGSSWNAALRAGLAARIMAVLRAHLEGTNATSTQGTY